MGVCPDRKNLRLYRRKSGSLPLSVPQSAQRLLYGKADGDYEAEGTGNPKGARLGKGLQTDGLYPLAGLLDYEDTRLKTSSHVRMGLSFAWKTSLAIQMLDLFLCNRLRVTLASSGVYINQRV